MRGDRGPHRTGMRLWQQGRRLRGRGMGRGGGDGGEDPEQAKLRAGLNSAIIREKPDVKWNDVAGLESAKQALQEAVILPVKFPHFFTGNRRPWRTFLLYGHLELESHIWQRLLQQRLNQLSSDSLCGQRGEGNESEDSRRIKTELLVQMQVHLGDTPHNPTESDFEILACKTEGFSGSDISICVKDVLFEPVRKTQGAMFFMKTADKMLMPCGPKQPGAVQTTMQELAAKGLASKILPPPIARADFDKILVRQRDRLLAKATLKCMRDLPKSLERTVEIGYGKVETSSL